MKKMVLFLLSAPSFGFASNLVPAEYTESGVRVTIEAPDAEGGQLISIFSRDEKLTFQALLSEKRFAVKDLCSGRNSNVAAIGSLIEANCNNVSGERFRLFVEQENGILKGLITREEVPGRFGGDYKLKFQTLLQGLKLK